jgi:hypothetical protein
MSMDWVRYQPLGGFGTVTGNVVLTAGTIVIGKAPEDANGGGVTVLEAFAQLPAGTVTGNVRVVDLGDDGVTLTGTIWNVGTVFSAGSVVRGTPNYWIDGGNFIGLVVAAGTVGAGYNCIGVGYAEGRSAY